MGERRRRRPLAEQGAEGLPFVQAEGGDVDERGRVRRVGAERGEELAWWSAGLAAAVAYQTGAADARDAVRAALGGLTAALPAGHPASGIEGQRLWMGACLDPFGDRARVIPALHQAAASAERDSGILGAAAWLLDESELAVTLMREELSRLSAAGVLGHSGGTLSALEWACVGSGRWDEALGADRLYLSPRTVASHLHRSYPKLGIAGRHQPRDLVDQAGADPGH